MCNVHASAPVPPFPRYDSKRFAELKCSIERKTMQSSVAVFFSLSILIGISLQVICEIRSVYHLDKMYEIERSRPDILMDKLAWPSEFSVWCWNWSNSANEQVRTKNTSAPRTHTHLIFRHKVAKLLTNSKWMHFKVFATDNDLARNIEMRINTLNVIHWIYLEWGKSLNQCMKCSK